ncbi:hypothetical protein B0H14DRAFT_21623 [Mycena olivaceomarginata]|nr:hypothetical protein B0H14DRAFT_21623 [Mycena olivaceomarginata]
MSFISNAAHFTLGKGVYNNVPNGDVYINCFGKKRGREEIYVESPRKRHREKEEAGPEILRIKHIKLTREIGSGPGYLLHAGTNRSHAVTVKVFNSGTTAREQLELTVAFAQGLMWASNVLRIEGISSPASPTQFIAYENVRWKNAEGPLAAALKDDLARSVALGFKMIGGISSGMNYLSVQGIPVASVKVEDTDIFVDVDDRFLISLNPRLSGQTLNYVPDFQEPEGMDDGYWHAFNALCRKVLRSANHAVYNERIDRTPVSDLDLFPRRAVPGDRLGPLDSDELHSPEPGPSTNDIQEDQQEDHQVPPRREYVWRAIDRAKQSLSTVASRIALDLDLKLSFVRKLARTDGQSAHRCAGYVREEITLATTTSDSAVVFHDAPSPREICSICHEVVDVSEVFQCVCGDPEPGLRPTVKCPECGTWSHSDCFSYLSCIGCEPSVRQPGTQHNAHAQPGTYGYTPPMSPRFQ